MAVIKYKDTDTGEWKEIKALRGPAGHTPERGTDYWTEEDQSAIIAAVLEQLPMTEGVEY